MLKEEIMEYKKIGMIGGVGPAATILYYNKIIEGFQEKTGAGHYPEFLIHSLNMGEVASLFEREEYEPLGEKLVQTVNGFHKMGCDFAVIACNGMHILYDYIQERITLPMISIIESVMIEVKQRNFKRVGLLGTTFAMRGPLYRTPLEKAGIESIVPDDLEQEWIMEAILGDLQRPEVPGKTVDRLMNNVEKLKKRGAEAIILACTDLPVAIKEENTKATLIDSTKIHVRAILDCILDKKESMQ
jgi:aspartate racemase